MSEAGSSASSGVLFTDQDEGQADDEGEDVRTQRLFVLPVAFGKHMHPRVDLILAQGLQTSISTTTDSMKNRMSFL